MLPLFALATAALPSSPNVLILFADDLGAGDLQSYGHPTTSTPHLDALAASGIRFTQWYSGFHVCTPSRAAMMTGRLPVRIGMVGAVWTGGVLGADAVGGLPQNETTIAEALKGAGYARLAVGKWHLGQQPQFLPTAHGFDEYLGIPYSDDMGASAWDFYEDPNRPPLPLVHVTGAWPHSNLTIVEQPTDLNKLSGRYVAAASDFISGRSAAQQKWLLYMAFNHVHTPDFASEPFCNATLRGRFGDALMELDSAVGQIMGAVKAAGALESTITFFTSDNGPWLIRGLAGGSAGLLRDGKQTTWEGGVREPGLIAWPGTIAAGRVSAAVVATYDIFPTVLALAKVPLPSDRKLDGRDLSALLVDDSAPSPHDCVYHWKGAPGMGCPKEHPDCPGLWAVRCGAYKLHYVTMDSIGDQARVAQFHEPPLIFQLENDPGESYPLDATSDEYKQANATLQAAAAAHRASIAPVPNQMSLGLNASLSVCCDRDSKAKYPKLPACSCDVDNYQAFVCKPVGPTHGLGAAVAVDAGGEARAAFDPLDASTWPKREPAPVFQEA